MLDLLMVAAGNLKLLVLGPIIAGLLAWGVASSMPKTFISYATIALPDRDLLVMPPTAFAVVSTPTPQRVAVMIRSPRVLDLALISLTPLNGPALEAQRVALASKLQVEAAGDGTIRLSVSAESAEQAQKTAKAIVDAWLTTTVPRKRDRADLESRLLEVRSSLRALRLLISHINSTREFGDSSPRLDVEERSALISSLNELQARRRDDITIIERALDGLDSDVVLQAPTLPTQQVKPKVLSIVLLASVMTGFLLLLFVFMRHAWRSTMCVKEI
ncbi:hypothetical protein [Polaromonas sp. AER18D-145]|uniref:hypothetical protein n=1 Tax=Polaromonas sp. AER18D-145 TaxID=1977060 RepID=UPI00197C182B|nr:hypothetical protein [Polaromonas sp. AER18D-145]